VPRLVEEQAMNFLRAGTITGGRSHEQRKLSI